MNFNHLKAFVKVVQVQSYQEAAKILNVSQPAITLRIKALEERFQTKLIKRSHDGISLTPQGELLYSESMDILKKWRELEEYYLSDQPTGKLTLGASTIPSEYILPKLLKNFRNEFPNVRFSMKVSGSKDVIGWLINRNVDLIVTGTPEKHEQMESVSIFDDELKIIIHPFDDAEEDNLWHLPELLRRDWILRDQHSNTRQAFEETLTNHGHTVEELNVVGQMGSTEAVISAVEAGLGISVVSSLAAIQAEKYGRVKILNAENFNISRSFYLSYLKDNKDVAIIDAFLSFVKKYQF